MANEGSKEELNFSPITDGLGFHPFSDGLPYAPVAKTQRVGATPTIGSLASGAGAIAAGPPRVWVPPARISVPTAARAATTASPTAEQVISQLIAQQKQQQHLLPDYEPSFGYLYLAKRAMAYLLDTALNLALCSAALSTVLLNEDLSPELLVNPGVVLIAALFLGVFSWALITAQEIAFGTTVGKRVFGLGIQGSPSALFLRAFFFIPSIGFCGLGLLWSILDSKKRCWHDLVVDVQPIEIARL